MNQKLDKINVHCFQYDYFKRNDQKKCIEISRSNKLEPVYQFLLHFDHMDCSQQCMLLTVCFHIHISSREIKIQLTFRMKNFVKLKKISQTRRSFM